MAHVARLAPRRDDQDGGGKTSLGEKWMDGMDSRTVEGLMCLQDVGEHGFDVELAKPLVNTVEWDSHSQ